MKNIALKDTRLAVIKAAQDIFAKFGYKKTTVDDIARAAHKVKSTIYQYFESKEDIFQTIIEKENQILKEEIKKAIEAQDNPKKKLLTYVITRMRVLKDLSNFYNALRDEYLEHFVFIEKIRKKYLKDEINTIKKILKNGVDQGTFVINDLELTACMIVVALKGLEYPLIEEIEVLKNEQGINSLLGVLFRGIEKR
ncbi:TetR/AcrR family transcriptional regulator [candidate division WOR-3 bacterium]|nr:TetR/AcrR family transcriptional regulator [candidate division WOR-3 bacterium]